MGLTRYRKAKLSSRRTVLRQLSALTLAELLMTLAPARLTDAYSYKTPSKRSMSLPLGQIIEDDNLVKEVIDGFAVQGYVFDLSTASLKASSVNSNYLGVEVVSSYSPSPITAASLLVTLDIQSGDVLAVQSVVGIGQHYGLTLQCSLRTKIRDDQSSNNLSWTFDHRVLPLEAEQMIFEGWPILEQEYWSYSGVTATKWIGNQSISFFVAQTVAESLGNSTVEHNLQ